MSIVSTESVIAVSSVCRVKFTEGFLAWAKDQEPGITPIPGHLLNPRQCSLSKLGSSPVPCSLKWHRDSWIPVITPETAASLVSSGRADYCPQSLLVYTREAYLEDNDVKEDAAECARIEATKAMKVIVAVIGEDRSALSVCRNIVSASSTLTGLDSLGRKFISLVTDATGAIIANSTVLIED